MRAFFMKFIHRLKYFLVGFGIGLILVFFFFKDRGWDWLPGNRITKFILNNPIEIDENLYSSFKENSIDSDLIYDVIENGSVLFSESITKEKIKNYKIELDSFKVTALVSFQDSSTKIINLNKLNTRLNNLSSSRPIYPSDSLFFSKILKKEVQGTDLFLCQLKKHNLNFNSISSNLKKSSLLRTFSKPYKKPNPLYFSILKFEGNEILIHMEEGSKKIRLKAMSLVQGEKNQNKEIENLILALKKANCQ